MAVSADELPPDVGGKLQAVAPVRIANQFEPRRLGIDDQAVEVEYQRTQSHRRGGASRLIMAAALKKGKGVHEPVFHGTGEQQVYQSVILRRLAQGQAVDAGAVALDFKLVAGLDPIPAAKLGRQHDLTLRGHGRCHGR